MLISSFAIEEYNIEDLTLFDCENNPLLFYLYKANNDLNLNLDSIIITRVDDKCNRMNWYKFMINELDVRFKNSIIVYTVYDGYPDKFVKLNPYFNLYSKYYLRLNDIGMKVYNYIIKKYRTEDCEVNKINE